MYGEAKKLHLIEEILKIEDSSVLDEVEIIINRNKLHAITSNAKQLKAFAGIWSVEEAEEMKHIIEDSCEQINKDDWK
jgi:HPt (histidine-containing phosphotransfer) domain-containing protein